MAYTDPTNTKILTFLNRAQTKIGEVSILVAEKVSNEARYETYKDEAEIAYGLISFIRSIDNNFNNWTEAEIVQYIDKWTAKANLNAVPYFEHSSFNLNIVFSERIGVYLPYGKIFVGDSNNVTAAKLISGDATMDPEGVLTIALGAVDITKLTINNGDLTIAQTDGLQVALDGKVDENAPITGATKTKITYDAKGLVTAGADIEIADISGLEDALDTLYITTGIVYGTGVSPSSGFGFRIVNNRVEMRGLLVTAGIAQDTNLIVLPVGYRPSFARYVPIWGFGGFAAGVSAITIDTNGEFQFKSSTYQDVPGTAFSISFSVDNISFDLG